MAGLAQLLQQSGHRVTGSDARVYPPMSDVLRSAGIQVFEGYAPDNLTPTPERVIIGNAIARGNPELEAALDARLTYTSMAEALEDLVLEGRRPIVITGTHGKTTTTSLVTWILREAGRDPGFMIGGLVNGLPATAALGTGPEFVIEGDEYDTAYFDKRPKFHHYRPQTLAILNLEHDHADIYPDLASIALEFKRLVNTVPRSGRIICADDSPIVEEVISGAPCQLTRVGFSKNADYRIGDVAWNGADQAVNCTVNVSDRSVTELKLPVPGRFNIYNATIALAIADEIGVSREQSLDALARFRGVARRLEQRGSANGITVWDDFAHHPTAIAAGIDALRDVTDKPVWAVIEPPLLVDAQKSPPKRSPGGSPLGRSRPPRCHLRTGKAPPGGAPRHATGHRRPA